MDICNSLIKINEMTRPGIIREETKKIIIKEYNQSDITKFIESLENREDIYLSFNYVINKEGEIINLVPKEEVSYFSNSIDINFKAISIGIELEKDSEKINLKQEKSIIQLLVKLCKEYKLRAEGDILVEYNLFNTRNFSYYIDNTLLFEELKRKCILCY